MFFHFIADYVRDDDPYAVYKQERRLIDLIRDVKRYLSGDISSFKSFYLHALFLYSELILTGLTSIHNQNRTIPYLLLGVRDDFLKFKNIDVPSLTMI